MSSRRKQAKPRPLKQSDVDDEETISFNTVSNELSSSVDILLPEMTGLNGGSGTPTSWRSTDTPDENTASLSPTSTNTLSSDMEQSGDLLSFTIGVTENTPYACHFCEKAFPRLSYLKRHEQVHSDQMPFKCDFCQRLFKHKRSRDRHVKLHTGDRKYRCSQCEAAFSRSDHLKIHMKTHDNGKPYQCPVCNRGYNTAAALTSHMQNHKEDSRCPHCSDTFSTTKQLLLHISSSHQERQSPAIESCKDEKQKGLADTCTVCREQFSSLEAFIRHRKIHEEALLEKESPTSSNFTCGVCGKGDFLSLDSLQSHTKKCRRLPIDDSGMVKNLPSQTNCAKLLTLGSNGCICEYIKLNNGHSNAAQNDDIRYFSDKSNMHCSQCNKTYSFASELDKAKIRNVTPRYVPAMSDQSLTLDEPTFKSDDQQFSTTGTLLCNQCNAGFPDFESFRTHLKSHLDAVVKKYSCKECEEEFPTVEMLDIHEASHFLATVVEYGCQSCLKTFNKPDQLQKHLMDIHAHQLYRCALCKEMFDSKVSIQVHFAVKHSNECHLYKCTSCTISFRSDLEFQMHVKVAHLAKMKPFRCFLCDTCFPTEIQLQIHLNSHKKQFTCFYCNEAFHVEFLLDKHIQQKHTEEIKVNDTEGIQNLSMKTIVENDRHFDSKQFRCDICDASFTSEVSLSNHRRQIHNIRTTGSQKPGHATLSLFCAYCNETCKSRTELENHMKAHTISPTKHKCNICDEMCPSAATLAEHKLSHCKVVSGSVCIPCRLVLKAEDQFYEHLHQHNSQGLPAPCVVCRQTLMTEIEVQVHAKYHLKNSEPHHSCCVCGKQSPIQHLVITGTQENHSYMCKDCFHAKACDGLRCVECHVKFENAVDLEKHQTTHRKTYQCIKCQMSFETEAEIQVHVASHVLQEGTNHSCHLCLKVYDSPSKLQCHLIEHTFEGCTSYSCYMCSAVFTSSYLIQQHMLEHGLHSRPYDCSKCHQKFFFRAELENHAFIHRDNILSNFCTFECPECPEVFLNREHFNVHRQIHDQVNFKCTQCRETFKTSSDLQCHFFRLHGEDKIGESEKCFPCSECDKVFPCLSHLQGHLHTHTQSDKYSCPVCNEKFSLSKNLHIHIRSHNHNKPYECTSCKKRFATKENRRAHIKSHSCTKPFMCPHCGKTFSRKCHMKEHMRVHITSTTNPCELCSESFANTSQLRSHLTQVHQKHFDQICTVCNESFEHAHELELHMSGAHEVRTDSSSPSNELMSESSLERSSTSGDMTMKDDLDSSGCSTTSSNTHKDEPIINGADESTRIFSPSFS